MADYNVGPGIADAMAAAGDEPVADSVFLSSEIGIGRDATYVAQDHTGEWVVTRHPREVLVYADFRGMLPTRPGQTYLTRPTEAVDLYVVHYTAGRPSATVIDIAKYQTGPSSHLDFPAIAYHLFVEEDGTLYWCHDFNVRTWGSDGPGVNQRAVHACYAGSVTPTEEQLVGLHAGRRLAERELGRVLAVEAHSERSATLCPGVSWPEWRHRI